MKRYGFFKHFCQLMKHVLLCDQSEESVGAYKKLNRILNDAFRLDEHRPTLDTVIFMLIAFYGVYSTHTLISVIISWWLYKVAMGILYTPLSYLGIKILRGKTDAVPAN